MMYDTGRTDGYLLIGAVGRARGLKGHVRVRPFTDDPGRFFALERAFLKGPDGAYRQVSVAEAEVNGDAVFLRFREFADRTAAETITGQELYILREDAVELPAGSYFIVDLIGCAVEDHEGTPLGTLAEVLQPGAADVYVVRGGPRGEVLFPALKAVILSTDIAARRIVVDGRRLPEVAVFED